MLAELRSPIFIPSLYSPPRQIQLNNKKRHSCDTLYLFARDVMKLLKCLVLITFNCANYCFVVMMTFAAIVMHFEFAIFHAVQVNVKWTRVLHWFCQCIAIKYSNNWNQLKTAENPISWCTYRCSTYTAVRVLCTLENERNSSCCWINVCNNNNNLNRGRNNFTEFASCAGQRLFCLRP